ncbi:zinc-binding dehydrogenase [Nocardioides sp. NPDC051685]|uniref:zinc-binding dehydrogenase n=1 Tax=Nocardioides sp. NPDC051685 TaxID=3364334 RepID=UPI0037B41D3F
MEANGICGSDVESFLGKDPTFPPDDPDRYPRINGHEIVGVIEDLGPKTKHRENLNVGDRVAVNPVIPCGRCVSCSDGRHHMCNGQRFSPAIYGFVPMRIEPGLWGGYSTHVYIDPDTVLYPFPADFDPLDATLWNPLGGAIQWSILTPNLKLGQSVMVIGTGQRGLACVAALRAAGAGTIIATGLSTDRHKLDLALEFGADAVVDVETEDLLEVVRQHTRGDGVDLVVDTAPRTTRTTQQGIDALRAGGTLVNVGMKTPTMDGFPIGRITSRNISVIGAANTSIAAYRTAAEMLVSGRVQLRKMRTHVFGFDRFEEALQTLQGRVKGAKAMNVVVTPTFT